MISKFIYWGLLGGLALLVACDNASKTDKSVNRGKVPESCSFTAEPIVSISAGSINIGSNHGYVEEQPEILTHISSFNIDATEVTNRDFHNLSQKQIT